MYLLKRIVLAQANCTCSNESYLLKYNLTRDFAIVCVSSMEMGETFEELMKTVDNVGDWLQEKGFSSKIIDAFKGMGHGLE